MLFLAYYFQLMWAFLFSRRYFTSLEANHKKLQIQESVKSYDRMEIICLKFQWYENCPLNSAVTMAKKTVGPLNSKVCKSYKIESFGYKIHWIIKIFKMSQCVHPKLSRSRKTLYQVLVLYLDIGSKHFNF